MLAEPVHYDLAVLWEFAGLRYVVPFLQPFFELGPLQFAGLLKTLQKSIQRRFAILFQTRIVEVQYLVEFDVEIRVVGDDSPVARESDQIINSMIWVRRISRKSTISLTGIAVFRLPPPSLVP